MSAAVSEFNPAESEKKPETLLAVLFGIAAIATAFSSYQASQLSGDVISGYNEGIRKANEVSQLNSEGTQILSGDKALFLEYMKTTQGSTKDPNMTAYIKGQLMRPELEAGVDWWSNTKGSGLDPFVERNPKYEVAQFAEADALNEEVEEHFSTAAELDEEGAKFDLITVLLAVTLFFLGLSTVMRKKGTRTGLLAIGALALSLSIGALLILLI